MPVWVKELVHNLREARSTKETRHLGEAARLGKAIATESGKYAFPESAVGERVLIQGSFYPKVISEEDARHIEEEAGGAMKVEREGYEFQRLGHPGPGIGGLR